MISPPVPPRCLQAPHLLTAGVLAPVSHTRAAHAERAQAADLALAAPDSFSPCCVSNCGARPRRRSARRRRTQAQGSVPVRS